MSGSCYSYVTKLLGGLHLSLFLCLSVLALMKFSLVLEDGYRRVAGISYMCLCF